MYLDYWSFERFPFENVPDPEFFFLSEPHEEGLTRLEYAARSRKGCAVLSGDIGCGKTTLGKVFLEKIFDEDHDVALISNPTLGPKQFLQDLLHKLNHRPVPRRKVDILRVLEDRLTENIQQNRETVIVVEEAQLLPDDTLEEIRLLLNFQSSDRFLLTIFLLGQPELISRIEGIRQLRQRVAVKYSLRPFDIRETARYILFRQDRAGGKGNVFSRQAIEMVYRHSGGMPRSINNLCDTAFLVGFGEKRKMITSQIVKDVIEDGAVF
jgi:general secretion pathway protein A